MASEVAAPGPMNTKAQHRSGAFPSDEAGKFLGQNLLGETRAWRKLGAAYAGYGKKERCRDRQEEVRKEAL